MSETAPMSDLSAAQVVADLRAQFAAEPDAWLIRKGGYYYRPNCQGYTTVKAAAGRYSEAKAKSEAAVEPGNMSAIRADDVPGAAFEISREQAAALLDHIAHQAARLEELELKWIEAVGLGAQAQAALTAAEAEKERLARESISLSALIDLTKGCQHDGGFDREIGPIGCSLGDGCVCCGIVMGARAALSEKEQGA